jgi:hypothetical protein
MSARTRKRPRPVTTPVRTAGGRARCPYLDVEHTPGASEAESSRTMASECASRRRASFSHRESLVTLPAA